VTFPFPDSRIQLAAINSRELDTKLRRIFPAPVPWAIKGFWPSALSAEIEPPMYNLARLLGLPGAGRSEHLST
jgi:hypothetical protein